MKPQISSLVLVLALLVAAPASADTPARESSFPPPLESLYFGTGFGLTGGHELGLDDVGNFGISGRAFFLQTWKQSRRYWQGVSGGIGGKLLLLNLDSEPAPRQVIPVSLYVEVYTGWTQRGGFFPHWFLGGGFGTVDVMTSLIPKGIVGRGGYGAIFDGETSSYSLRAIYEPGFYWEEGPVFMHTISIEVGFLSKSDLGR